MHRGFPALAFALLVAGCASLGPLPPPPTTAEILKMAKDGVAPDEIIKRIEASEGVYPLSASELARLREQGVPDQVIDYLQRTYIDAVRFDEYLRARDAYFMYGWPYYRGPYPYPYGWPYPYWRRP
ncbi:MAG: hypothetical protein ABWZ41_00720 [Burkholderiales bacterium]